MGAEKINDLLKGSIKGIRLILVLVFLYIYLQLELGFFPWTRPFAGQVLGYVLSPLITIGKGFSKNISNLIFITVLVLLVRYTLKAMKFFFLGIEKGSVKIQGLLS